MSDVLLEFIALKMAEAHEHGTKLGAVKERAKIVTWIRRESQVHLAGAVFSNDQDRRVVEMSFKALNLLADAVERGEYRRKE